jgi:PTH1 family peptidyl-tRNA hydrolase
MDGAARRLIVGLGNPGKEYAKTRHNLGYLIVQELGKRHYFDFRSSSLCQGLIAEGLIRDIPCQLLLPLTYMNHSGQAVKSVVMNGELAHTNMLIVCDDIHVNFGQLRLRRHGSAAGHNGLRSIVEQVGTQAFPRLRCGVSIPSEKNRQAEYVLGEFTTAEKERLEEFVNRAADCCEAWISEDIETVMNQFNGQ